MANSDDETNNQSTSSGLLSNRSSRVQSVIAGLITLAVAGLLLLSAVDAAGVVGSVIYGVLFAGLGIGYWLVVGVLLVTSFVLLLRSYSLPQLTLTHAISSLVFLVSFLALIHIGTDLSSGLIGSTVGGGMARALSVYASAIMLEAIAIISLVVLFDEFIDLNKRLHMPTRWQQQLRSLVGLDAIKTDNFKPEDQDEGVSVTDNTEIQDMSDENAEDQPEKRDAQKQDSTDTNSSDDAEDIEESVDDYEVTDYEELEQSEGGQPKTSGDYTPPPTSLLSNDTGSPEVGDVKARANKIKRTLNNFNITVEMDEVSIGPTVTRYALKPAEGVRLSKITNLQNELEMELAAHPVRIEAPIPGKSLVGVEVPNEEKTTVGLASLINSDKFQDSSEPLLMGLGQGISGDSKFASLSDMPHLLIGGATGSGKSVTAHALINSLLFRNSPEDLKLIMVDPKRVELTLYNGIPHLLTPVITSAKKAILAMKWAAQEMENRYDTLEEVGATDIHSYHDKLNELREQSGPDEADPDRMPHIVIVIDEMADLMQAYPKDLESVIVRIAQKSRAVGIHLILSTQRPDVDVVTGLIKANVPARIALKVSSQVDSRTILDGKGAEQLLGEGDMLFQSDDMPEPERIQSAFISEDEVKQVASHLKDQYEGQLQDSVNLTKDEEESKTIFDVAREEEKKEERDEKYEEALETVVEADKASTSYLQRKLRIGYSRAARIMDELEENGIITEKDGTKARDVLITKEQLEAAREGRLEQTEDDSDDKPDQDDDAQEADNSDEDDEKQQDINKDA
jgi:S-DNA-T family DNA segregation ATPase FtsK/SpoIIIE